MKTTALPELKSPSSEEADRNVTTAILPPSKLRRDIPLSQAGRDTVTRTRVALEDIFAGRDEGRLAVICGPCSIDDVNSALVYAERMRRLSEEVADKIVLVMRTYFEKPRSVVGWKGMLYDPLSGGESSPSGGMTIARRLAVRLNESGVACATEFLNPLLALYLEDCMAYGSIGSRTVESQIHRELASRLALPVGMKNAMDGNSASALNAVKSAQCAHSFFGQDLEGRPVLVETQGNAGAHIILRGGSCGPNYSEETVAQVVEQGRELGLVRPVVVDCSHGNSGKDHRKQPLVAKEIARQVKEGQNGVAGIMLESHLVEGRQDANDSRGRRFGQSITDACIGWKDTEYLVKELADGL
ncbi:3-deoxy-7-phosphoheptulonate synthase [Pelagicoccus mobilis]|uniref:Phospho-2-dehydro-3-deoxyheptonate aldolase n=1 Tax=Pelagicoccus mobilis TaxID=415221 RepID=A0A934RWD6_9BACT|nr:3-deoxy-7-phosphoheptulonate synthase [Pelagicoccus mobilis]MBK1876001.1 3-deoxy-7-phosphoheptulonate synthase [Pelagicoccus mobilis]